MALVLVACSDDGDGLRQRTTFEAMPGATEYVEETETRATLATRTDPVWPAPYKTYDQINNLFPNQKDLVHKSIGVFFTKDGQAPIEGTFTYRNNSWHLTTEIDANTYQLYGYIPKEDAASASIAANGTYSNGAILNLVGLRTLTPSDVCVIIGAKSESAVGFTMGNFDVNIAAVTKGEKSSNKIYLLFDHIYAALRFNFKIDAEYAALRTIKLRKLELIAYGDDSGGGVKAKFNATITLQKTAGTSPIVGNITYTPDESSANVAPVALYEWDENPANDVVLDDEEPTNFMGTFVPGINTYFKLRSTYDVYENTSKSGEHILLRQNCVAENTIDLREKFFAELEYVGGKYYSKRGHCYNYTITVHPTYLYVLSHPDLDNPSVSIN